LGCAWKVRRRRRWLKNGPHRSKGAQPGGGGKGEDDPILKKEKEGAEGGDPLQQRKAMRERKKGKSHIRR